PSHREGRMRGERRPSGSGYDQGPGSGPITTGMQPRTIQRYCNGPATDPATLQRGSSEGRARVQRGPSKRTILGGQGPQRAYRVTGQEACSGLTGPLRGGRDSTAPATSGQ